MILKDKQLLFSRMVARLLNFAHSHGYEIIIGWAYRPVAVAEQLGFGNSLHTKCLAIDLELFKDGMYLTKTKDHAELGKFWKSIGGSWGGDFNDGNHYSLEHKGVK